MAEPLPNFEEASAPRFCALWGNVGLPLLNHCFLSDFAPDIESFEEFLDFTTEFAAVRAAARNLSWMLSVCEPWAPAKAPDVLKGRGFDLAMPMTYMVATQLQPSHRPVPNLEFRRIHSAADEQIMTDLNCLAYSLPLQWGEEANSGGRMFQKDAFGYVAFRDGEPVSTATALVHRDCLNIVGVATPSHHRGKGYAEAVIRHAIDEAGRGTGLTCSVLHATQAGYHLYLSMGYQPGVCINAWCPASH